ncbi:alpha/beta hydrolase [Qipengyuania flava]|uniref:alpha/beta hydrolase n=1 Tax=Qipengyuania flava TaxID=192812 RepID=UPI00141A7483|nr:alpha/beta hydrolase [Qipengyuania flava]NIJ62460.1 acetyl esterase/lipase [Qipengyuania flava]
MRSDRRSLLVAGLSLSGILAGGAAARPIRDPTDAKLATLELWPDGAPGFPDRAPLELIADRAADPSYQDRAVAGITAPRVSVFQPERPTGASVLLLPGGGYRHVVIDKEGYEMGRWLASRGITAFVLFYRLPGDGWAAGPDVALSDAQRAMRLIRSRAREWGLDPARVNAMGFSAGGHLCADLATRFDRAAYEPVDAADTLSARPDSAACIYPVISMEPGIAHAGSRELLIGSDADAALERAHSPDENVPADAPPFFLLHAEDDASVPVENTLRMRAALKARDLPVETHLFEAGGHGFGLRKAAGKPVEVWPELWLSWARTRNFA